ncbi:MAG: hypothetical protein AAB487_03320, partial [Patescibacteria group bacterium]
KIKIIPLKNKIFLEINPSTNFAGNKLTTLETIKFRRKHSRRLARIGPGYSPAAPPILCWQS